jgi:hypothetical protein
MRIRKRFEAAMAVLAGLALLMGAAGAAWGAYVNNGDGTVTDTVTGLMWQQADDGQGRTWESALSYCEALDLAGRTDWRLPDIRELQSIVDDGRYLPAINPAFSCENSFYWSGSTYAGYPDYAWHVHFGYGYAGYGYESFSHYVRCVRGGPSGSLGHLNITEPDGGEVLAKGHNYTITWVSQSVSGAIQIDLYRGGSAPQFMLRQLAAATPNTGSYPFNPPADLPDGNDYLIGISAHNGTVWDFSNGFFTIKSAAVDSDGDGTPDDQDGCPNEPNKIDPGVCGCGFTETDTNNDGEPDCIDNDDDGDGMPDDWEIKYGLNPLVNDAYLDYDGDGIPNIEEYKNRTHPSSFNELKPKNLKVIVGKSKAYLDWECETPLDGLYFTVEKRMPPAAFQKVETDGSAAIFYETKAIVWDLSPDTNYEFRVVTNYRGGIYYSESHSAKTPLKHDLALVFKNPLLLIPGTGGKAWKEMNEHLKDFGLIHGGELKEDGTWRELSDVFKENDWPADHVGAFYTCNYPNPCDAIVNNYQPTRNFVDKIREAYRLAGKGHPKLVLAGQSLGGLRARSYIQKKDRDAADGVVSNKVKRLITIGTPNRGVLEDRAHYDNTNGAWSILLGNAPIGSFASWHYATDPYGYIGGYLTDPERFEGGAIDGGEQWKIASIVDCLRLGLGWDFNGQALKIDVLWDSPFMKRINCWETDTCDSSFFSPLPDELEYRYVVGLRPSGAFGKYFEASKLNYFMFKGEDGDGFISVDSQNLYGLPNHPDDKALVIYRFGQNHLSELEDYFGLLDAYGLWTLKVVAKCPVDIEVEAPSGRIQSKTIAQILGSRYSEADVDGDGEIDKIIEIPFPEQGDYKIKVTPQAGASPTATYSLELVQADEVTVVKANASVSELNDQPFIVPVNALPIANAGEDHAVEAGVNGLAVVTLDGSNSSDRGSSEGTNDDIVKFEWFKGSIVLGQGEVVDVSLAVGVHEIILVVTDRAGAISEDKIYITVLQNPNNIDNDGDGYTEAEGDCNDGDPAIHPGAKEICGDGIDNNCNGKIDEACSVLGDLDGDGDVDQADYAVFRTTLGKCKGAPGFSAAADYDGDGCVTLADYRIWYGYFKKQ